MRQAGGKLLLVLLALAVPGAEKRPLTAEQAAKDPAEWAGLIPDQVAWAPDGKHFYYHAGNHKLNHPDQNVVFEVPREGGSPRRLSESERLALPPLDALDPDPERRNYSRDQRLFVYANRGDVFLTDTASGRTRRLTNTDAEETAVHFSHDDRYVLFESGQNLFGWTVETGELRQFTRFRVGKDPEHKPETDFQKFLEKQQLELFATVREAEQDREQRNRDLAADSGRPAEIFWLTAEQKVADLELSPDARWVTFRMDEKPAKVAEVAYQRPVTKSGFTEPATTRPKSGDPAPAVKLGILAATAGTVRWAETEPYERPVHFAGLWWSPDGQIAAVKVLSDDFKDLWISRLDCSTGKTSILFHDHDDAWIPIFPPAPVRWMPDSRSLYFTSERDGYRHLYTMDLEGHVRQRTHGRFDLWVQGPPPALSRDGQRWYFHANIENPAEAHLYSLAVEGGDPVRLTPRGGQNLAALAPDETRLALLRSTSVAPDEVWLQPNAPSAPARRIENPSASGFAAVDWVTPEFVDFPDAAGVKIPARLFKPRQQHPLKPALIQIHGSGYTQIVRQRTDLDYLHTYLQYLVAQGYTVLEIDYPGSAGYGRDFRTSIYRRMGGQDLDSAVAAADYLVKSHGLDRRRIGIFGRSYGGFLTLMALFTKPGVFAAGAAMAPVTDWAHYNHGYAGTILNLPQVDEESFRRSSPIYFAPNLADPLLIFHGMVDSNVLYQDSARLAQRLVELKKTNWELISYPVENHVLENEDTKLDCLRRLAAFFDAHLKKS